MARVGGNHTTTEAPRIKKGHGNSIRRFTMTSILKRDPVVPSSRQRSSFGIGALAAGTQNKIKKRPMCVTRKSTDFAPRRA